MRVLLCGSLFFLGFLTPVQAEWIAITGTDSGGADISEQAKEVLIENSVWDLSTFFKRRDKILTAIDFYQGQEARGRTFQDLEGRDVTLILRQDLRDLENAFEELRPGWRELSRVREALKQKVLELERGARPEGEIFVDPQMSELKRRLRERIKNFENGLSGL
jgi:hypothetical protein